MGGWWWEDRKREGSVTIDVVLFQLQPTPSCPVPYSPRPMKTFEVAEVVEEADSPPLSDLSAQSSLENVASLLPSNKPESHAQDLQLQRTTAPPPVHHAGKKVIGGLESASDSQIGSGRLGGGGYLSESCTPEPTAVEYHHRTSYPSYQLPHQVSNLSYMPHHYGTYSHQWSHAQHPAMAAGPTEHYHTTSYFPQTDQRHALSNSVYVSSSLPPAHHPGPPPVYAPPPHPHSVPSPQPPPPPHQAPTGSLPAFSDVPQADLLAKAFMTFLHSIGAVFRDPEFKPLLQSLDQHFEKTPPQLDRRESSESAPPPSPPISPLLQQDQQPLPGKLAEGASNGAPLEETVGAPMDSMSNEDDVEKELLK